jgi:nitrogen regulatory protein P-II 1
MKKIEAIVKTSRLEDVVHRLRLIGLGGMTVGEVHGVSPSTATATMSHGQRFTTPAAPRYLVTVVVVDDEAAHVVNAILHATQSGAPGDGIITVTDVLGAIRIRTGETNADAL